MWVVGESRRYCSVNGGIRAKRESFERRLAITHESTPFRLSHILRIDGNMESTAFFSTTSAFATNLLLSSTEFVLATNLKPTTGAISIFFPPTSMSEGNVEISTMRGVMFSPKPCLSLVHDYPKYICAPDALEDTIRRRAKFVRTNSCHGPHKRLNSRDSNSRT